MTKATRAPMLVLGSAIAMTTAGSAEAALVSTVPLGFTAVTINGGPAAGNAITIDLDRDGTDDFTLAGTGRTLEFSLLQKTSAANLFGFQLSGESDPANLSLGSVKSAFAGYFRGFVNLGGGLGEGVPTYQPIGVSSYIGLATNFRQDAIPSGSGLTLLPPTGTLGYLQGIYTPGTEPVQDRFQVLDFGLIVPDVPEPASWLMMIAGFGGIGALRRRARANAASPATC